MKLLDCPVCYGDAYIDLPTPGHSHPHDPDNDGGTIACPFCVNGRVTESEADRLSLKSSSDHIDDFIADQREDAEVDRYLIEHDDYGDDW